MLPALLLLVPMVYVMSSTKVEFRLYDILTFLSEVLKRKLCFLESAKGRLITFGRNTPWKL